MKNLPAKRSSARDVSYLQRGIDDLFDDFFSTSVWQSPWSAMETTSFVPACDIQETDRDFKIALDLPGLSKEDVKIEVNNNQLIVSGERREEKSDKSRFSRERYYGTFTRYFSLPAGVDADKVDATYENGVLEVVLPKTQASHAKLIQIKEKAEKSKKAA